MSPRSVRIQSSDRRAHGFLGFISLWEMHVFQSLNVSKAMDEAGRSNDPPSICSSTTSPSGLPEVVSKLCPAQVLWILASPVKL